MLYVIDPQGIERGAVNGDKPNLEAVLRLAYNLDHADVLMLAADDTNHWRLSIYRPGKEPALQPLDVASHYVVTALNKDKTRAAMVEAAWLDLVDAGWVLSQNRKGSEHPGSIYRRT